MIEKVNPMHPDKIADRIAGALVDLAYLEQKDPKIAIEVLIGHRRAYIIAETSVRLSEDKVIGVVQRIAGISEVNYMEVPQDFHLADNQKDKMRAGDNGIFKGVPVDDEVRALSEIARDIYMAHRSDGKYILDDKRLIICQSKAFDEELQKHKIDGKEIVINPLGYWIGGTNVDTGATNRKLGSDMGRAVTGGGLHGKDLSKADVSVNIYAHLKAQETGREVNISCAIGDELVDGKPYSEIVEIAHDYIKRQGGFERFAEWGLV